MGRNAAWLLFALALALLILPMQWVAAAVLAAVWHEACHYLAIRLYGGTVTGFGAGIRGADMQVRGLTPAQELLCSLAGPAGSFALLMSAKWLPRTALCAGFQGLYNLLPIYPLDGGRAVRCMAEMFLPPQIGALVCKCTEMICLCGVILLSLYGCFCLRLGLLPLVIGGGMVWRVKIPCKPWRNSVQ